MFASFFSPKMFIHTKKYQFPASLTITSAEVEAKGCAKQVTSVLRQLPRPTAPCFGLGPWRLPATLYWELEAHRAAGGALEGLGMAHQVAWWVSRNSQNYVEEQIQEMGGWTWYDMVGAFVFVCRPLTEQAKRVAFGGCFAAFFSFQESSVRMLLLKYESPRWISASAPLHVVPKRQLWKTPTKSLQRSRNLFGSKSLLAPTRKQKLAGADARREA